MCYHIPNNNLVLVSPPFLPVLTIVEASYSHKSNHTWAVTSPFLWNADCPFFKWLASRCRSGAMALVALIVPQTLAFLSSKVTEETELHFRTAFIPKPKM